MRSNHCFIGFYSLLLLLAIFANSRDWWLDIGLFAAVYAIFWSLERKNPQPASTALLFVLIPVPHLLGALGLYHWDLGGLSWDILVHITTSFLGVLFLYQVTKHLDLWKTAVLIILAITIGGVIIEVVEATGGESLKREGEGVFYRGAGDFCTSAAPCSAAVDTAKDAIDNALGALLAITAILTMRAQPGDAQPAAAPPRSRARPSSRRRAS